MGAMTRRGMEKALAKLEDVAVAKARSVRPAPFDEADWLAWFTQAGQDKHFAREPDFPVALAMLKDELTRAKASTDPPFDPPEDVQSEQRYPHIRRENWRHAGRFPALCEALGWLREMDHRLTHGIPPCCEAERAELASWFAEHESGLDAVAKQLDPDGLIPNYIDPSRSSAPPVVWPDATPRCPPPAPGSLSRPHRRGPRTRPGPSPSVRPLPAGAGA